MAIVLLATLGLGYLSFFKFKMFIGLIVILTILTYSLLEFKNEIFVDLNSRPLQLLQILSEDKLLIVTIDKSINERLSAIYISNSGAMEAFFVPQGLQNFAIASENMMRESDLINKAHGNKIMSFIGAFVFELSFVCIFYFYYIFKSTFNHLFSRSIFYFFSGFLILSTAVPAGLPLLGYMVASLRHRENKVI